MPPMDDGYLDALIASSPLEIAKHEAIPDAPAAIPARAFIDWPSLEGTEPPAREWDIEQWIPSGKDTLLAGRGGIGKTLIAQCIASSLARGFDYIGEVDKRRKTLLWAGEDDTDELWRRQNNINRQFQCTMADIKDYFHAISYHDADITLAATAFGVLGPTPLLAELREQVNDLKIELVMLDNIARIFGGSENDRHQVTQFMAWLRAAIKPAGLLLLGHPAKAQGSEFSGSTAWEGAVRARLWISDKHPDEKPTAEDDLIADDKVRYISKRKANYSNNDVRRMTLIAGVLVPDDVPRETSRGPGNGMVKDSILRAIRALADRDIYGNESTASPNYLPKLMREYKLLDGASAGQVAAVIREMILAGELVRKEIGKNVNRTPRFGLQAQ